MAATELDPELKDVGEWISLCEALPPVETYCLLGLLADQPKLTPSLARARALQTGGNVKAAKKWMRKNFRTIMQYYCGNRSVSDAVETILGEAEEVKRLAFILFGVLKIKLGLIVAALYLILKLRGEDWCEKYEGLTLAGEGPYEGSFPGSRVTAFFEISYLPQIEERVENPAAYPLKVPMPVIEVEKDIKGKVKVPTKKQAEQIFYSFKDGGKIHKFAFNDLHSKQDVNGTLDEVYLGKEAGLGVFEFRNAELSLGNKRL